MAILSTPLQILESIPTTTKWFTAATVVSSLGYLIFISPQSAPYLYMVPGNSLFYPWTFATAGLIEPSYIGVRIGRFTIHCDIWITLTLFSHLKLIFTVIFTPASLRYLERLWGPIETLKFIAITLTFHPSISRRKLLFFQHFASFILIFPFFLL